jgi:deoxyribodipyrimidine photo-lyase
VDERRVTALNIAPAGAGPVLYWMSRDQRADDNWALLFAQAEALERRVPLGVVFCLAPTFLGATARAYEFMLAGLAEVRERLAEKGIALFVLRGEPAQEVAAFAARSKVGMVVADFDPLRPKLEWRRRLAAALGVAVVEVDAHNLVPCRWVSPKREFGAYTLRPKLHRALGAFLTDFPALARHPWPWPRRAPGWGPVAAPAANGLPLPGRPWATAGAAAGRRVLARFVRNKLARYAADHNDPCLDGQSNLSPYLHFGQLSAQRVALAAGRAAVPLAEDPFLEQLLVRRELSDNFCLHTPNYDSVECFPAWARATLRKHAGEPRPYRYTPAQLEAGETHDPLWNAAQMEMVRGAKMHGYLRMYWAKKILEWTGSVEEAMETAIVLNDRYELDGRDPNGYAGIAWALGGVHDRPWTERPIFGKIRYMNDKGCRRKFDVDAYVGKVARGE